MCRPPPRSKLVTTSGYRCPLRPGLDARDPAPAPGGIIEFLDEGTTFARSSVLRRRGSIEASTPWGNTDEHLHSIWRQVGRA